MSNLLLLEDDISLIDGLHYSLKKMVSTLILPVLLKKQKSN